MKKIFLFPITWGIVAALLVTVPQLHHSQFRDDDYVQLAVLAGKVTSPWMGPFNDTAAFLTALPSKFAAMLGSLIPLSGRPPNPHVLIIPFIGGSVLVGFILFYWWRLTTSTDPPRYRRTADNKLEMEIIPYSETPGEGRVVLLPGLRVTVSATETRGTARVEFEFDHSLDDESYRFLVWRDGRLHRIEAPPVGQSVRVGGE